MSWRETLDQINPFDFVNAAPANAASHNSGEREPSVMPAYVGAATDFVPGFDPDAFFAAIEPAPLFLQDEATYDADDVEETLQAMVRLVRRAA